MIINLIEWKQNVRLFRHFYCNSCTSIENCTRLGFYEASSGNSLPTFLENLYVPSIGCPKTSVWYYHYLLCNNTEEHSFHLLRGGSLKSRNTNLYIA